MDFWTALILFVVAAIIFALVGGYLGKQARAKELAQNPAGIKPVAYATETTTEEEAHHDTIEEIVIPEEVEKTEEVAGAFVPVVEETAKKVPVIEKEETEAPIEVIKVEPEVEAEPKAEAVTENVAEAEKPPEEVTAGEETAQTVEEEIPETKVATEKKD